MWLQTTLRKEKKLRSEKTQQDPEGIKQSGDEWNAEDDRAKVQQNKTTMDSSGSTDKEAIKHTGDELNAEDDEKGHDVSGELLSRCEFQFVLDSCESSAELELYPERTKLQMPLQLIIYLCLIA